jgi:serine/threonine protein phosphatase PrpC
MRHVLTNVVGARAEIDVEVTEHPFGAGVTLLLCSDGLHGALDDATMAAQLASPGPVSAIASELVRLALERDGRDNITAVVLRWSKDETS